MRHRIVIGLFGKDVRDRIIIGFIGMGQGA